MSPDGSPDINVFDNQQGVAIIVAVKRRSASKKKPPASVFHGDLWGDRETKYKHLWDSRAINLASEDVSPEASPWRFKPTDKELGAAYQAGFSLADLFSPNGRPAPGIVTTHDEFAISWTAQEAARKVERLLATADEADARQNFRLCSQSQWNYATAKSALADGGWRKALTPIAYRPFDQRFTVYNPHVAVHRRDRVMRHLFNNNNIALMLTGQTKDGLGGLVSDTITGHKAFSGFDITYNLPLYLYPDEDTLDDLIRINFDHKLFARIREAAHLTGPLTAPNGTDGFRKASGDNRPDEVKIFDYIYGVLYSPLYRETYTEFLKTDFPRIPFPASPQTFAAVSAHGETLRRLHLMEEAVIGETLYAFEGDGDSVVGKPAFEDGRVWINDDQSFAKVPAEAWKFRVGGYQPAQKWLKDRKGLTLAWDDIRHYQRIIKVLVETDRIMHGIELAI